MQYVAKTDSFDGNRIPKYCFAGRLYEFDTDPGACFSPVKVQEENPVEEKTDKEALLERAKALGAEVDGRTSVAKLKAIVEDAGSVNE